MREARRADDVQVFGGGGDGARGVGRAAPSALVDAGAVAASRGTSDASAPNASDASDGGDDADDDDDASAEEKKSSCRATIEGDVEYSSPVAPTTVNEKPWTSFSTP